MVQIQNFCCNLGDAFLGIWKLVLMYHFLTGSFGQPQQTSKKQHV